MKTWHTIDDFISKPAYLALAVLAGCAPTVWHHPTKSTQQFYADKAECSAMGGRGSNNQIMPTYGTSPGFSTGFNQGFNQGAAIGATMAQDQIFDDCMMGRGWSLSTTSKPTTIASNQQTTLSPTPTIGDNRILSSDASYDGLINKMRSGGFDWYAKQTTGAVMFFSSKTIKRENEQIYVVSANVFKEPTNLVCDGVPHSTAYMVCKLQIDKNISSYRILGCNFYSTDGSSCEGRSSSISGYKDNEPIALWLKAYGL